MAIKVDTFLIERQISIVMRGIEKGLFWLGDKVDKGRDEVISLGLHGADGGSLENLIIARCE